MLYNKLQDISEEEIDSLLNRGGELTEVKSQVEPILTDIRNRGDSALNFYTKKFDGAEIEQFEISPEEIENAFHKIDEKLIRNLKKAAENIRKFHFAQLPEKLWFIEIEPGVELGQKFSPLENVGAYVPGGRASYPSTALMTIIPAKVAGVKNVIMCTPPGADGTINPLTLAAAKIAGADHVYRVGGVQAIGAMAYGTETIKKVDKIVGPGNVYVTTAKMLVRDKAEIDFPAGPSEVLIIADESADARMVASDIVAQSEHDPQAVSVLITTSDILAKEVKDEVIRQSAAAKRHEIIDKSLENSAILITDTVQSCIEFSNRFAPEHLEIVVSDPESVLEGIENAGSIFVGSYAPVSAGDYASGTNHVLPTAGYAKIYSGLNINHFIKYLTIQKITKKGLENICDPIISIAEEEGLYSHADAVRLRFDH
ncbi:histidinol dehydrogenase [Methanosalsum zhilinae DSM 4017]|uniref:Histidinol dehydrogenase n=1 Tax=Methanosalsum zhilinae (strain DSM 4017 / NBRC 107636 / OCM 62 / WeN5) TaxID=679901 RepID=F7XNF4_METZD|nr:histidinol dehydrogenase [Methanosalsum zhilinae]AEH61204.1 histidinol dehydrogenase [Methanosalsum zhilinae DSM 4017]